MCTHRVNERSTLPILSSTQTRFVTALHALTKEMYSVVTATPANATDLHANLSTQVQTYCMQPPIRASYARSHQTQLILCPQPVLVHGELVVQHALLSAYLVQDIVSAMSQVGSSSPSLTQPTAIDTPRQSTYSRSSPCPQVSPLPVLPSLGLCVSGALSSLCYLFSSS